MLIKQFNQLGEVPKRAGQTVYLVDDDIVDPARPNVIEEALKSRSHKRSAGIAAIVIGLRDQFPAFLSLTPDVRRTGFALSIERVEVLFEALVG
jgi:hypothetical protein